MTNPPQNPYGQPTPPPSGGGQPGNQPSATPPQGQPSSSGYDQPTQQLPPAEQYGQPHHGQGQNPQGQYGQGQQYGQPQQGQYGQGQQYGQAQQGQQYGQPQQGQYGQGQQYGQAQQGQYGQAQYGQPQQGGQYQGGQYQGGQYQGPGAPSGAPPKKSRTPLILGIVGVLVVALIVVFAIRGLTGRGQQADPPVSPSGTSAPPTSGDPSGSPTESASTDEPTSASSDPSSETSDEPAQPAGDTLKAITLVTDQGFSCTDEGRPGFVSQICTHYDEAPAMSVYVGGFADGTLGRLTLNVQSASQPTVSKKLSTDLIAMMAGADAAAVQTTIAKGTSAKYAEGRTDTFDYRGKADGSVVMHALDFPPGDAELKPVTVSRSALQTWAKARGYACTTDGAAETCQLQTAEHRLRVRATALSRSDDSQQMRVSIYIESKSSATAASLLKEHATALYQTLGEGGAAALTTMDEAPSEGSTEYRDGYLIDYYPASKTTPRDGYTHYSALYILASCWSDLYNIC
ncbi:hypothetical protein ACSDQ9_07230 [Aestuariimicrobium soli]|uniref:hypothetical protein n=1 Tax=Aestuariimicrobium soli TaxID=2035834 RepID=UPI003EB981E8